MTSHSLLTRLKNRIRPFALRVRRDRATGHLFYRVHGVRHFIRFPEESLRAANRRHQYENIYFKRFEPNGSDCVVDVGAGLGTEIIPLAKRAPKLRYFAVEIQPWVFECLSLTLAQLPFGFRAIGHGIAADPALRIQPTRDGLDATTLGGGAVEVPAVSWDQFAQRYGVRTVDLLKVNIEGGETALLHHVPLERIRRVLVNVHDFRADRGEGEHFRTRAAVEACLTSAGFTVEEIVPDWLYAERR